MSYQVRLKVKYNTEVVSALKEKFGYKNVMEVPRLTKICINQGVGAAVSDKKLIDNALGEITQITGQKPIATLSRKAISNFKLREKMPIGVKVTLRNERMYEFLDRLVAVALPRVRDFKGIPSKGFDGRGNYTLGVTEQIIFPEINIDKVSKINGMHITFEQRPATTKKPRHSWPNWVFPSNLQRTKSWPKKVSKPAIRNASKPLSATPPSVKPSKKPVMFWVCRSCPGTHLQSAFTTVAVSPVAPGALCVSSVSPGSCSARWLRTASFRVSPKPPGNPPLIEFTTRIL